MSEKIRRLKRDLKFKGSDSGFLSGYDGNQWGSYSGLGFYQVTKVLRRLFRYCDDGKILMVRQYRNALERYTLEIPAGALDAAG